MHFRQLEAFVHVIKLKSFSRAAEEIYLSQPTISAHISALESEFGVKLIIRSTKEVTPSWAGKILYEYATEILKTRDKAILALKSYATNIQGTLDIAASTVPAQYLLPELLPKMSQDYPDLFFSIKQCDSKEVVERVMNMEAEIGMIGTIPDHPKCAYEVFCEDRLVVIAPNTPKYREIPETFPPEMLRSESFLMREHGSGTRKETEDALARMGVDAKSLRVMAEMASTESIKQAVVKGLGISIISNIAAEDYVRFGSLLSFDVSPGPMRRKFYFIYHCDRPLSPAASEFVKYAREQAAGFLGGGKEG